jgi:hypothetical protein
MRRFFMFQDHNMTGEIMVQTQLISRGINDPRLLDAMMKAPGHIES